MQPLRVWLKAGHTVEIIRRLLPEFMDENDITVEVSVVAESDAHDALVAGASHPDVITAPFWYIDELLERGVLAPLAVDPASLPDAEFAPLALAALTRAGMLYALPHTLTGGVLSYREDRLTDLGLSAPRTLDDVIQAHHALRRAGHGGLAARANAEFSSLATYAGWSAARNVTLLPNRGVAEREALVAGVSDLVEALGSWGTGLSDLDYDAVGELIVEGRASMLFDTSAWAFRFEADGSPVRGRMGYGIVGDAKPAQFLYAEGLAVTAWSERAEDAAAFLRWRHSERVVRAEVEEIGRIDIPRLDLRRQDWFVAYVRDRGLGDCLRAIDASWAAGDLSTAALRPDFVERARELMGVISSAVAEAFPSAGAAYDAVTPSGRPA